MTIYQNTRTGQLVELISYHDTDYAMVRSTGGGIGYVALKELVSYEPGKGRTGTVPEAVSFKAEDPDKLPDEALPIETRLNVNTATAEMIAQRIKGVGYSTAKKIIELRNALPGERFKNLDQLRRVGRVDWDQVIADDLIFVA